MDFSVNTGSQIIYVVTANGYKQPFGSEIYLVGVFDNREDANRCVTQTALGAIITEVELNKPYPLKEDAWGDYGNELFLGGYCE